jgi:hypothetical protein
MPSAGPRRSAVDRGGRAGPHGQQGVQALRPAVAIAGERMAQARAIAATPRACRLRATRHQPVVASSAAASSLSCHRVAQSSATSRHPFVCSEGWAAVASRNCCRFAGSVRRAA